MTAPILLDPAAATRPDPTLAVRHGIGVVLGVAAPVLLLAGTLLSPPLHGTNAQVMAALPPVADRLLAAHVLNSLGALAYLATALVLLRIPVVAGAVLRLTGAIVLGAGFVGDALGDAFDGYAAWAGVRAGVPAADLARLFDVTDSAPAALPISWLAIPVAELGAVVLLLGVLRARRAVPAWAPATALLGVLLAAAFHSGPLALLQVVGAAGVVATVLLAARSARVDAR